MGRGGWILSFNREGWTRDFSAGGGDRRSFFTSVTSSGPYAGEERKDSFRRNRKRGHTDWEKGEEVEVNGLRE